MLDLVLLVLLSVVAIRVGLIVRSESGVFREFGQSRLFALLVPAYPLAPLIGMTLTGRVGWLPAFIITGICFVPGIAMAYHVRQASVRARGTPRVRLMLPVKQSDDG